MKKALKIRPGMPANLGASPLMKRPIEGLFNAAFLPQTKASDRIDVVCRKAYYKMDDRSFMIGDPILSETRNVLVKIDTRDGKALDSATALAAFDELEDIRFFPYGGDLFLFAVGFIPAEARPRPAPVIGRARRAGDGIDLEKRFATEHIQAVEKNWVYFERAGTLCLEKFPGMSEIYEVDAETLALSYIKSGDLPFTWSGTKSATVGGGNLFLDHRRIYILRGLKTVQRYIYRFRYVPSTRGRTRISSPFSLGNDSVLTYVSDIAVSGSGDDLLIAASYDDSAFEIFSVSLGKALATLGA